MDAKSKRRGCPGRSSAPSPVSRPAGPRRTDEAYGPNGGRASPRRPRISHFAAKRRRRGHPGLVALPPGRTGFPYGPKVKASGPSRYLVVCKERPKSFLPKRRRRPAGAGRRRVNLKTRQTQEPEARAMIAQLGAVRTGTAASPLGARKRRRRPLAEWAAPVTCVGLIGSQGEPSVDPRMR
jgi:hypothetical protein